MQKMARINRLVMVGISQISISCWPTERALVLAIAMMANDKFFPDNIFWNIITGYEKIGLALYCFDVDEKFIFSVFHRQQWKLDEPFPADDHQSETFREIGRAHV